MEKREGSDSATRSTGGEAPPSSWRPLRRPLFRALWIATIASNVGTWIHDVGAAWLMTSLAPTPLMVALVQAATSLPMFLLALPAGALADILDRRRVLLGTQSWMLLAAAGLAFITIVGAVTPILLLALTAALGIGAALNAPAWQAITRELVPNDELPAAVSLNSLAINGARAVGPAVGGLLVAVAGPQAAFGLNALSFLGVIAVLLSWRRVPRASTLPVERFVGALRAGLRYAHHAPGFRSVLVRATLFLFPASALWALLPLVARERLGLGASGYGMLLGALGVGAIGGALVLPRLRRWLGVDGLTAAATLVVGLALLALALLVNVWLLAGTLAFAGSAWISMLSSLNLAAQAVAAGWVRARALSVYLVCFFGAVSLGSLAWGSVAEASGISSALIAAAVAVVLGIPGVGRFPLQAAEGFDVTPSLHWPAPAIGVSDLDRGPVLVTVEYVVALENVEAFVRKVQELRARRLRDGALQWGLFGDPATPGRYLEFFVVDSWLEHLRQHERVTTADREIQETLRRMLDAGREPIVTHYVAPELSA